VNIPTVNYRKCINPKQKKWLHKLRFIFFV
jgi:hypothetical protein